MNEDLPTLYLNVIEDMYINIYKRASKKAKSLCDKMECFNVGIWTYSSYSYFLLLNYIAADAYDEVLCTLYANYVAEDKGGKRRPKNKWCDVIRRVAVMREKLK